MDGHDTDWKFESCREMKWDCICHFILIISSSESLKFFMLEIFTYEQIDGEQRSDLCKKNWSESLKQSSRASSN